MRNRCRCCDWMQYDAAGSGSRREDFVGIVEPRDDAAVDGPALVAPRGDDDVAAAASASVAVSESAATLFASPIFSSAGALISHAHCGGWVVAVVAAAGVEVAAC